MNIALGFFQPISAHEPMRYPTSHKINIWHICSQNVFLLSRINGNKSSNQRKRNVSNLTKIHMTRKQGRKYIEVTAECSYLMNMQQT